MAAIDAPHFCAGIVLWNDRVIEAADILKYMRKGKWSRDRVREYCKTKGWKVSVITNSENVGFGRAVNQCIERALELC